MDARIVVTQYTSLDGVIEDPVGMEGSGLGDWTGPFTRGPAGDAFKDAELAEADAMIYGRRTYDGFAAVWPTVPGAFAERMNGLPKYLASRTISQPEWSNTMLMGPDIAAAAAELKQNYRRNILIYGSASVCHELARYDLIDEYALMVYPVVLGRGIRQFPDGLHIDLALIESRSFNEGIVLLRYGRAAR
jgi:dihydrofolate reductase